MSAVTQPGGRANTPVDPGTPDIVSTPQRDNPLQLLREAIDSLKTSGGELPDQAQVADLLAEAQEALEHANLVARCAAQCEGFVKQSQFEEALALLDVGLLRYPGDPALLARRREVEGLQGASRSAAAVESAIMETVWLLNQNRVDLAVEFLKRKVAEMPDQPALVSRLDEINTLLPEWEQQRNVQATLSRAAKLEDMQQGQAAMTILEEALQTYPASQELIAAAESARDRLTGHERKKKLARRLEIIGQKIAAQSWKEALALLKETRKEFPDVPELKAMQRDAESGLRSSESAAIITAVRQCVADGELDQAEKILARGLASLGRDPALGALFEELESDRRYRDELHAAQVHFARRQLSEAEIILIRLAEEDRPEAQALLEAVRGARAATEEEDFCERGRQKALLLVQQEQFAQAVDLLRNLLTLFPGDPILQRDLLAAQSRLPQSPVPVAVQPVEEVPAPQIPQPGGRMVLEPGTLLQGRLRLAAIAGTASLVLVSGAAGAWKLTHRSPPAAAAGKAQQHAANTDPAVKAIAAAPPAENPKKPSRQSTSTGNTTARTAADVRQSAVLRPFVPVESKKPDGPDNALPPPPVSVAIVSASTAPLLPSEVTPGLKAPEPPDARIFPAPDPPPPSIGGKFLGAQITQRTQPEYPAMARQLRITGTVSVQALIDEHGGVKDVQVLSGTPILALAAKSAVQKWKFKAATLNGQAIESSMAIQVSFSGGSK